MASELNGNWKLKGKDLGTAIVKDVGVGSYFAGAGNGLLRGGNLLVSINANNSVMSIAAYSAMSAFYGAGLFDSGYKVVPVAVLEGLGSVAYKVQATGSIEGSVICFIPMVYTINAAATASTLTVSFARGMTVSANFVFQGMIISTP